MGTGTLVNSGASVLLTSVVSVTGNYAQSDGTLAMGIGSGTAGELLVSGDAAFSGGTVAVTALTGSNLIAGQSYTIAEVGGTLTTSNLAAAATGFSATLGTGTNGTSTDLLLTLLSDYVSGTLGTLTNSGTINAPTAVMITSAGSLGTLANSGTIIGNVVNASANDLVITGGTGGTVGSFSGGTIHNSLSNLTFASGAVSLGDAIDVSGHTVSNSGASLTLANDVSVTGAYSQSAGTLSVAGHVLSVSGAAVVTGGLVDAGLSGTANYLVGDGVTLIQGGTGSSYTGATVTSGLTGLDATGTTSGTNLLAVAANDYIGGAYGTLAITGTLANTAGGATALYIARTGTLGALANSGTIAGNITNLSSGDLSITGGSGSVVGVFTGGTIANTGANVVFAGGAVALGDAIDVGGTHTVSNIGASLNLTNDVAVSGTYAQTAGTLTVGGHVLTVSGPALVSGGTVSAGLASVGNYLVGDSVTMITGGAGSSYTGATVTSGLTGPGRHRHHQRHQPAGGGGQRLHRRQLRHAGRDRHPGQHRRGSVGAVHRLDRHAGGLGQQRHHRGQHHQPVVGRPQHHRRQQWHGGPVQRRHDQQHIRQRGVRRGGGQPGRCDQRGQPHGRQHRRQYRPGPGRCHHRQLQPVGGHPVGQRPCAVGQRGGQRDGRPGQCRPQRDGQLHRGRQHHPDPGWGGVQLCRGHGDQRGDRPVGHRGDQRHQPAGGGCERLHRRQPGHAERDGGGVLAHRPVHRGHRDLGHARQQRHAGGQHHQPVGR
ncbi:MAG: hypothetical protein PW843_30460 [Azospirillaceae bacterium]|nr:hypothetical protein [Azospirillaceae bacterium]